MTTAEIAPPSTPAADGPAIDGPAPVLVLRRRTIAAFVAAAVMAVLVGLGHVHHRRTPKIAAA